MARANGSARGKLGIVIVGRGGTERLRRCLSSIDVADAVVVYVDRSANDRSCELAHGQGVDVVRLDLADAGPFSRARNEGFQRLIEIAPAVELVQFADGDCELAAGWLSKGMEMLADDGRLAAACGLIRERKPCESIYNRLRDLERTMKIGEIAACSNAFLARRSAFEEVGGFDDELSGGDVAELCSRLRAYGWRIRRADTLMCLHDAGVLSFAQWWRSEIAHGHGALDLATRFGSGPDAAYVAGVRSARMWGIGVPAAVASAGMVGASAGGPGLGLTLAGTALLALPAQSIRVAARASRGGQPLVLALAYGGLSVMAHFAHVVGQYRYVVERAGARRATADRKRDSTSNAATTAANDEAWQADKRRYGAGAWLTDRSIWAVATYRFGRRVQARPDSPSKTLLHAAHGLCHWLCDALLGIDLPLTARIGAGLRIHQHGGVVVRPGAQLGANVTLAQGCTVGTSGSAAEAPVLEDDVELGAYAQVLDGVRIGRGARVTAMSVVMSNVAARVTVAGNPAKRVVKPRSPKTTPEAKSASKPPRKPARKPSAKAARKVKSAQAKPRSSKRSTTASKNEPTH